ncbi:MAG: thiolase family protein [Gammaproteobacteria bacterium]|nr:thiolase family protein [Gammaproteobacteria bacterium]
MAPSEDPCVIVAATRSAVVPVHGAFKSLDAPSLGAEILRALLADKPTPKIDHLVIGNALYGGGNPARLMALMAGIHCPAQTVDMQCASGLSAIGLGAAMIQSGQANWVVAGGVESASTRPLRAYPTSPPTFYDRPRFSPGRDPDMPQTAAELAAECGYTNEAQWDYAIESHRRSQHAANQRHDITAINGIDQDPATRELQRRLCARTPSLAEHQGYRVDSSTTALSADAAALVLMTRRSQLPPNLPPNVLQIEAFSSAQGDAECPPAALNQAVHQLGLLPSQYDDIELMEAFAAQAMFNRQQLQLPNDKTNRQGGALARGHPIGASGAILVASQFHRLNFNQLGLCAIASGGGLGVAMAVRKIS